MGHIRRGRFAAIIAAGLLVSGGMGVAMAQGGIAANLAMSGTVFDMRVNHMVGDSSSLYVGPEKVNKGDEGVSKLRFGKAKVRDLCLSVPVGNIPGYGKANFVMKVPGDNFSADNLLMGATKLTGDIAMSHPQIGIDPNQVDNRAKSGSWGLAASQMVVDKQQILATSVAADQLKVSGSQINVKKGDQGGC